MKLNFILKVLDNIVQNKMNKESQEASKVQFEKEDFEPNITLDNLLDETTSKSLWRGNLQSVQLAAKMVNINEYIIFIMDPVIFISNLIFIATSMI